jgi:ribosomal protein L37AE/L43A
MPAMPDEPRPTSSVITPIKSPLATPACSTEQRMVCERCGGANVYRMHAVWRCADCGFKTDCCGW